MVRHHRRFAESPAPQKPAGGCFDRTRPPCYNPPSHELQGREFAHAHFGRGYRLRYTKATDGRHSSVQIHRRRGQSDPVRGVAAALAGGAAAHFSIGGEDIFVGELAETQSRGRGFTLDHASSSPSTPSCSAWRHFTLRRARRPVPWSPPAVSFFRKYKDASPPAAAAPHVTVVQANGTREDKAVYIEKVRWCPAVRLAVQPDARRPGQGLNQRFVTEKIASSTSLPHHRFHHQRQDRYSERGRPVHRLRHVVA